MSKYVIYTRVSTKEQGEHGVSLAAQLDECREYIKRQGGENVGEFYDVQSGASRKRPQLIQALATAKINDATIVFFMLDRLARDEEYAHTIKNSGVKLLFLDHPDINELTFSILIAVAADERRKVSARTKAALDYRKKQLATVGEFTSQSGRVCTSLGNPDPTYALECARVAAAAQKIAARVNDDRWMMARKTAEYLRAQGDTLDEIAAHLNATGHTTRTGGEWQKWSVSRMLNQRIK